MVIIVLYYNSPPLFSHGQELANPSDKRIFAVAAALYNSESYTMEHLRSLTRIDPWFLYKMNNIITMVKKLNTVDYKVRCHCDVILT